MRRLLKHLADTARLMVGQPDYDRYTAHRAQQHPGEPVMSKAEFFRERMNARYGIGRDGKANGRIGRCC